MPVKRQEPLETHGPVVLENHGQGHQTRQQAQRQILERLGNQEPPDHIEQRMPKNRQGGGDDDERIGIFRALGKRAKQPGAGLAAVEDLDYGHGKQFTLTIFRTTSTFTLPEFPVPPSGSYHIVSKSTQSESSRMIDREAPPRLPQTLRRGRLLPFFSGPGRLRCGESAHQMSANGA